jgi:hypothetical protein
VPREASSTAEPGAALLKTARRAEQEVADHHLRRVAVVAQDSAALAFAASTLFTLDAARTA